jgi:hypothetical protein
VTRLGSKRFRYLFAIVAVCAMIVPSWQSCLAQVGGRSNFVQGEMIYRMGERLDGTEITATVVNDVPLSGGLVSCARCHRKSGYGIDEPGKLTPAVTGQILFRETTFDRARQFRALYQEPQTNVERAGPRSLVTRPGYSDVTLAKVIREGIDSNGRTLNPLMPRYDLDDESMADLIAYLRRLSSISAPGVGEHTLHFGIVSTDEVRTQTVTAMMNVVDAYVDQHNREVDRYSLHRGNSPNYRDDFVSSYRKWKIHHCRLTGEPFTYAAQLTAFCHRQHVFALIAGVSNRTWDPIQRFCDRRRLPCLFPTTPLPALDADGGATLYLSKGLYAEADKFVLRVQAMDRSGTSPSPIHQFAIAETIGEAALRYASNRLRENGVTVRDHLLPADADSSLLQDTIHRLNIADDISVFWMPLDRLPQALVTHPTQQPSLETVSSDRVYLSATLLSSLKSGDGGWDISKIRNATVISPFRSESQYHPRGFRVRGWMRSRRIKLSHPRLQFNTYFALTVTTHALRHMVDRYSQEYLIECIEHETENSLNPGVYPRLSLGPDQRYASNVVRLISVNGN